MLFNSIDFAIFLPIVLVVFWALERMSFRFGNAWLFLASMFFYGWWDWRFLGLVFVSGGLDYWASIRIERSRKAQHRKIWLFLSVIANLGLLGFFDGLFNLTRGPQVVRSGIDECLSGVCIAI